MKKLSTRLIALLLCAVPLFVQAQEAIDPVIKYANTITEEDLKKHLSIIASDEYEGRETGEKGQKMAAEYLKEYYKSLGLPGPVPEGDPYFQTFELAKVQVSDDYHLMANGNKLELFQDFFPYGSFMYEGEVEVVFAGYAIEHEKYNDFAGLDVKGKAVVFMEGEPKDADGNFIISGNDKGYEMANPTEKRNLLKEKGALIGVRIFETDTKFSNTSNMYKPMLSRASLGFDQSATGTFGYLLCGPTSAAAMLGTNLKKLEKTLEKISKKGQPQSGKLKGKMLVNAVVDKEMIGTENVLAFMEGTDLKDEILVITSHYDHIGIGADGEINNGADDDGSGTVSVLEIAEAFTKAKNDGNGPRRSILFMNVTGEEKGLLGSEYYSNNPIFPIDKTVTNLNIDMVGRIDPEHEEDPDYVYIIGSDMLSSQLHELSEEVAAKYYPDFKLDYKYNAKDDPNRFYYRSDHYNFAKHNIPIIFYFNGVHEDYHRPGDEVEKIAFEQMMKRARLIFATAWEVANRDNPPAVDKL